MKKIENLEILNLSNTTIGSKDLSDYLQLDVNNYYINKETAKLFKARFGLLDILFDIEIKDLALALSDYLLCFYKKDSERLCVVILRDNMQFNSMFMQFLAIEKNKNNKEANCFFVYIKDEEFKRLYLV